MNRYGSIVPPTLISSREDEMQGQIQIDQKRLARVKALSLGAHGNVKDGMCAMEAVAYVAREPWSDHPECACPVLSAFMRSWNDGLPDDERTSLLLPLIPRLVGT